MDAERGPGLRPAKEQNSVAVLTEEPRATWRDQFNRLADRATLALGSAVAVSLSILLVIVWALLGPVFQFSDSWQLFINTTTTVITFWMVFVIQNSQNRDARAIHLKLDEIIRASEKARNEFIVAEKATEAELDASETELQELGQDVKGTQRAQADARATGIRSSDGEGPGVPGSPPARSSHT